jgi:hypothetical protein
MHKLKDYIKSFGDFMKVFLLFLMMTIGWFAVYSLVWICLGFPVTVGAGVLLVFFAVVTEVVYFIWVDK